MENNSGNSGQGKFFNGFLLGLLIGAAIVFLLGTKKGKRILKSLSEGGADKISNILEEVESEDEIEDEAIVEKTITPAEEESRPKIRRFFRGISKRAN